MKKFMNLHLIVDYIDKAFEAFYETMLNDTRLTIFFKNEKQIKDLIEKQKRHFQISLEMPIDMLKKSYITLGEFHYELKIPYIDFIKGTDILQEHFLLNSQKNKPNANLMNEIFEYFKIMKAYTAKGYLNKMLLEDKKDIQTFFEQTNENQDAYLPRAIILEKIQWLKKLIYSIENSEEIDLNTDDNLLKEWLKEEKLLSVDKKLFFEDLEKRIMINTQNLFYFLKREEYLEILPLYTSLLSIYKLTLMMNNAITIEYANKIIENMKLDSLTGLFRKEHFQELLKKEISLCNRENTNFSIAYIDIDHFKKINDTYGHFSGDKVIEKIGEVIIKNIRASDFGFRIGGDEFALLLKNATAEQTKNVCKKITESFTNFEFIFNEKIKFTVTLSIGISEYKNNDKVDLITFLKSVDDKLYEAKNNGRNNIAY